MALNDKGAYWLSEFEEIRNPYFGDAMLTCGEVVETYRKGQRVFANEEQTAMPQSGGHNH
jgi:Cu(I)/Ag(I) efflux system membrane fusion protein